MIAEIIPLARLPKNLSYFDYEVPENLEGQVKIGQMVRISFRGKNIFGVVINLKNEPAEIKSTIKPINKIIGEETVLNGETLKLLWFLSDYYSVSPALILKTFIPEPPLRLTKINIKKIFEAESLSVTKSDICTIKKALEKISSNSKNFFLLKYRNQKNKIAVLLKIAEKTVGKGQGVLILEPQITDIEAIAPYFMYSLSDKIAFLHGNLSKTEYWVEWQKIRKGQAKVVIGTRSAIFSPFPELGLIIVDNEEAPDFKQSDQNPRYDSRLAALKLSDLTGAKLICTSQAPRPETYFLAENKEDAEFLDLEETPYPVTIVDMNNEVKNKNFSSLSGKIKDEISSAVKENKKVVLLLNRRGSSTLLLCRDCGYTFTCKNCQAPLVCHEDQCNLPGKFICHSCGQEENVRLLCPNCHGASIRYLGVGTQTVERELKKVFAGYKILRIDQDAELKNLAALEADIFIGTQFFIRNYLGQIKNIGLLGIISADTLVYRPDFRSGEKTFSWLTGLINFGRQAKGHVLIQTFFPNNFFVQAAAEGNYELFYEKEIEERKILNYPPFGRLIKLSYIHPDEKKCFFESSSLLKKLTAVFPGEAEISWDEKPKKEKQKFSTKIIIKFKKNLGGKITNFLKTVSDDWTIDMDPESLI